MRLMLLIAATAALSGAAFAQNTTAPLPPAPMPPATTLPAPAGQTPLGLGAGRGGLMQACQADFVTLCPGMTPGDGKLGPCIRENRAKLSPACQGAMQARRGAVGAGRPGSTPPMTPPAQ